MTGAVETHVTDQIVQSMRMQFERGGGEASIELNSNFLGRVQVQVRVEHGVVSANVQASTPLVREWITTHRDELTQTLAQQGLRLDKLEIAEPAKEQPARDNTRDQRQAPRESSRQRRDPRQQAPDTFEHDLQENS
jgi:flagellar hook-length control protein FliK